MRVIRYCFHVFLQSETQNPSLAPLLVTLFWSWWKWCWWWWYPDMEVLLSPMSSSGLYTSSSNSSFDTFCIDPMNSSGLCCGDARSWWWWWWWWDCGGCVGCGGGTTEGSFDRSASRLLMEGVIFSGKLKWLFSYNSAWGARWFPWKCHCSGTAYPPSTL